MEKRKEKINTYNKVSARQNNAASNIEQVLEAAPHKAAAVRPLTTQRENYPS